MRCHIVLNAFSDDFLKQAAGLDAFLRTYLQGFELGITYCVCGDAWDQDQIRLATPTRHTVLFLAEHYQPETILEQLALEYERDAIYLFGNDYSGRELSVRLAARIGGSSLSQVSAIYRKGAALMAEKSVYANQVKGIFELKEGPFCIWITKGEGKSGLKVTKAVIERELVLPTKSTYTRNRSLEKEVTAEGLEDAPFLLAAGKGVGSKGNIELIKSAAKKLGSEWGVSRPVAMNAWAPMHRMLGASGSVAHPKICIAAGVSGAAAFYMGIEKSKWIVAINDDMDAPIMKKADVVIEDDCMAVLEELCKYIDTERKCE